MATDKLRLTLHLKVSRREARELWQQLAKHFGQEHPDEVPENVCPQCGSFKRGDRVGPDKLLCFRCHSANSSSFARG
jgi:hypothetical protein